VGRAPPYGLWSPAPLSDVVANKLVNAEFSFYQTAWLMVHHFLIESYEDPIRARQTAEYIRRYDAGEDPVDAFLDSYDTTMQKMRDELNLRRVDYRFAALTLPRMEYEGDVRKRVLAAGEELYLLGDLAVELDEFESAHEYFDEFEELGIDSPLAMKVRSRRLITLGHEDRMQEGDALAAELLALDSGDADVLADLAHYAFDRYAYAVNHREARTRESLNRSIELGTRALERNPGDLEALYYLGLAYEQRGEIQRAADALLESYDINPSVPRLNTALARVLVKGRQIELASYLLSRVYSATHSEETRTRIRAIQDAIESDEFDIASIDSML
jgi:tetratricopeptide (TPR) repeat protein